MVKNKTAEITVCGLFVALIAIGAYIKIDIPLPLYTMHFSLQWFFVIMLGLLTSVRQSIMSAGVYLLIGLSGIPVFAAGGGPGYVLRPGFGFLLGFIAAAGIISYLLSIMKSKGFRGMLAASSVGLLFYYGIGAVYFCVISNLYTGEAVSFVFVIVQYCFITMIPDFILCVLASSLCGKLQPVFSRLIG
ncbi:MAG: biotin transporter BioY [Eubacterium sp.]|nr:biotin transporter BioY [Eubacterium sp.]